MAEQPKWKVHFKGYYSTYYFEVNENGFTEVDGAVMIDKNCPIERAIEEARERLKKLNFDKFEIYKVE